MNEITNKFLLEKYETLISVVDDLQSKIVKLAKFYEQVKEKYNIYDEEVEKALSDMRSTKKSVIAEISASVTSAEKDLGKATTEIKTLLQDLSKASQNVTTVIKKASEFDLSFPDFEKRLFNLEQQVKNGLVGTSHYISFDYDEVLTGVEIWEKYNGKTRKPIIVQMPAWKGDYCMVLTDYDEEANRITGRMYKDGEPYSTGAYPNGKRSFQGYREFKVYESPNEDLILEYEEDEE